MRKALAFIGRSGSGKGTISDLLSKSHGWPVISTGELIRAEAKKVTTLGERCRIILLGGLFLSPDDAIALDRQAMEKLADAEVMIFEGSPRSAKEALFLAENLDTVFIHLDTPESVCRSRLLKRGRPDDKPEIIKNRFASFELAYHEIIDVVVPIRIEGNQPPEQVLADIEYLFFPWFNNTSSSTPRS